MHVGLVGVPPRTEDPLRFIVVGGGVAGLATAWSLQQAGHRVTVFEQQCADPMAKYRESVRSTPSMTKILDDWGIGDELSRISSLIRQITFLDGKTGEELGLVAFDGKVLESLPAPCYSVQFGRLFTVFYDLAKQAGVELHYDTKVVSVDPWQATITSEDGRQWSADVIVGADGTESIVRPVVLEATVPFPDLDNRFTLNLVVPADMARRDKELAPLLDGESWTGWFGDDCLMHGVLTGPGPNHDYEISMIITIQDEDVRKEFPMSLESLRVGLFEPRAQKLLKMAEQLKKIIFNHYEPFDNWVHESGKVVLIGEAAHPILPCGAHGSYPSIEDAMTLSALFSLPATKSQTPMLLNVYEELRQPRCATVQRYARRKREVITLPHGPAQQRRDALLRDQRAFHQEDDVDDDFLCATYTGLVQLFGFDAREAVHDWWVKLGKSVLSRPHHVQSEDEDEEDDGDDGPMLVPAVVDAEVEREYPMYPIISDPLMGDDDDLVCEVEAHRRNSISSLHFLRQDSS